LGGGTPVIGVAKNRYRHDAWSIPVLRGVSKRPLFVTSAGIEAKKTAEYVRQMHGDHRIPTILNVVDRAARDGLT
jgi:deoxyribonuclease V